MSKPIAIILSKSRYADFTRFWVIGFLFVLMSVSAFAQNENESKMPAGICVSQTEWELYKLINEYRAQKGLPAVKLSLSLCFVAHTHANDQALNFKDGSRCNMHSWSAKGKWSSCCYTPDHNKSQCMWDKPRELTNYRADGFEISYWTTATFDSPLAFAKNILDGWKHSSGHNDVIMNKNTWKDVKWLAMGVGVHGEYADVWFGQDEDAAGEPMPCE